MRFARADQSQNKPTNALSMNSIAFLYGAQTRRLKKIIHKTRDRDLCRRANAVLLVLKGKTKSEVASLLQAGRSSLNRWLKWYDVAGVDGLKTKGVGRPVRQNRDFICGVLKILLKYTPRTLDISVHAGVQSCLRCCWTSMQHSDPQFNNQTLVAQSRNCLAASYADSLYPRPG